MQAVETETVAQSHKASLATLTMGALGVVFGDIGTSPLYTLRECLRATGGGHPVPEDVLGLLSLIFWSLTMVVTVKYLTFIMRADNRGEGGIFALLAIVPERLRASRGMMRISLVAFIVVVGAALLYGDGAITPAISVLSAIEGLTVVRPSLAWAVVPATCVILLGLFSVQHRGTGAVGAFFGPVMAAWFITIGALGAYHIAQMPGVLAAISPHHAIAYFVDNGMPGFLVLGSVVLAVTGGEALYADMGHFGVRPIRIAWLALVMPALVLCYFGQGALVLTHPEALDNPFFAMVPTGPATFLLVGLSSAATIIASQALISGAFSLTRQAQQLGYFPRVNILHTAAHTEGQIYIPQINWVLATACLLLVLGFQKSERLASAYGIAVTGTMMLTSIVFATVMRHTWKWNAVIVAAVLVLFLSFDVPFFVANTVKVLDGGWVPVMIGVFFVAAMLIWTKGRTLIFEQYQQRSGKMEEALPRLVESLEARTSGTAVFMSSAASLVPPILIHLVERTHTIHRSVLLLTVITEDIPSVPPERRVEVAPLHDGFCRVVARYGFMQTPNVPMVVREAGEKAGLSIDLDKVTYFLGRERVLGLDTGAMGQFAERIFGYLQRNAVSADRHFQIPADQVIEIGIQLDL
ncbi:KUP/HAK/KT family potassium transporter [Pendulispora brunnea]|uniref:Probable potassium transport system protein Kup n=1 Tax=Pendulispora brunnea TaxID=2905690 RepID=A0ABZ2KJ41_9BACT